MSRPSTIIFRLLLTTSLLLALPTSSVQAQSISTKRSLDPDWTTDPSQFFRRAWHRSVILGDYLYIDGGELYYQTNDSSNPVSNVPENSTYSIPLASSWDPATVKVSTIDKGSMPTYSRPNLWAASDNKTFFGFNGDLSGSVSAVGRDPPVEATVYQFTPDDHGGGSWSVYDTTSVITQSTVVAQTNFRGQAYLLGGWQNWRTSQAYYTSSTSAKGSADGIVIYDMQSKTWKNESMTAFRPSGWSWGAQLVHLDGIGTNNLLLAMGGNTGDIGGSFGGERSAGYDVVSIYNTDTNEWRNQSTSGDIPPARDAPCSVGVRGDNNTYEIFLYAGNIATDAVNTYPSAVYVLSIPNFNWHRATTYDPSEARYYHTCHNVPGTRQMIVVGGIEAGIDKKNFTRDEWPQGLGVFDMTALDWQNGFDSRAAPYVTPSVVKDYITSSGEYPVDGWSDRVIEQWVMAAAAKTPLEGSSPSPSSSASLPPSASASSANSSSAGSDTGAIAGGVVGGLLGLIIIAALAFFILRRRTRLNNRKTQAADEQQRMEQQEKDIQQHAQDMDQHEKDHNQHLMHQKPELAEGVPPRELVGSGAEHELPVKEGWGDGRRFELQ